MKLLIDVILKNRNQLVELFGDLDLTGFFSMLGFRNYFLEKFKKKNKEDETFLPRRSICFNSEKNNDFLIIEKKINPNKLFMPRKYGEKIKEINAIKQTANGRSR